MTESINQIEFSLGPDCGSDGKPREHFRLDTTGLFKGVDDQPITLEGHVDESVIRGYKKEYDAWKVSQVVEPITVEPIKIEPTVDVVEETK